MRAVRLPTGRTVNDACFGGQQYGTIFDAFYALGILLRTTWADLSCEPLSGRIILHSHNRALSLSMLRARIERSRSEVCETGLVGRHEAMVCYCYFPE